jgi:hypothetical protein
MNEIAAPAARIWTGVYVIAMVDDEKGDRGVKGMWECRWEQELEENRNIYQNRGGWTDC